MLNKYELLSLRADRALYFKLAGLIPLLLLAIFITFSQVNQAEAGVHAQTEHSGTDITRLSYDDRRFRGEFISNNRPFDLGGPWVDLVLIHGYVRDESIGEETVKPGDLRKRAREYWDDSDWYNDASYLVSWPMAARVNDTVMYRILRQNVMHMAEMGICVNRPCVFITHSTGDLIAREMIKNITMGYYDGLDQHNFRVVATFDLAGAGAGSKRLWTGLGQYAASSGLEGAGTILDDLIPSNAVTLATGDYNIARFRLANRWGMTRQDDGVVPIRSMCGSKKSGTTKKESLSCHGDLDVNGKKDGNGRRGNKIDSVPDLMHDHHPLFMMDRVGHTKIMSAAHNTWKVPALKGANFKDAMDNDSFSKSFTSNRYRRVTSDWHRTVQFKVKRDYRTRSNIRIYIKGTYGYSIKDTIRAIFGNVHHKWRVN